MTLVRSNVLTLAAALVLAVALMRPAAPLAQGGGKVEVHFIAFDVKASTFAFLKDYNGYVVEAADAKQLEEELTKIYEKRILIESD